MLKRIAFCALWPLTGCVTDVAVVKPQQTIEVRIPIPVACLDDVPAIPKTAMPDPATADTAQLAAGAATDIYALQQHAERVDALLRQCAKPPEVKP